MIDVDPIGTGLRNHRRSQRLGPDAACVLCGQSNPATLRLLQRSILESHHVCGRNHDALTVPVCRNCHAILTEQQRMAGVDLTKPETFLHQLANALRSLFALLAELGNRGYAWANALYDLIDDLDAHYPDWRHLVSANVICHD